MLTPEPGWIFQGERQSCGISLPQVAGDERNLGLPITSHLSTRAGKVILVINTCSADTQNGFLKNFYSHSPSCVLSPFFSPLHPSWLPEKEARKLQGEKNSGGSEAEGRMYCWHFSLLWIIFFNFLSPQPWALSSHPSQSCPELAKPDHISYHCLEIKAVSPS